MIGDDIMDDASERLRIVTWADFDDFWQELEASHEETPYTFDAYDEEVARIAFKAGRESMRRQLVAMIEHHLATRSEGLLTRRDDRAAAKLELGRTLLHELTEDVSTLVRAEDN
jgi:hypothetical protein